VSNRRTSCDPGTTVGVDIDYPWQHLGKFEDEIRKTSGKRLLTFYPSRLDRIRVTFSMPGWEWMQPGTEAEELAERLAEAGFPVVGGFISRTDFWHAQAALDQHDRTAERAKDNYPVEAANSAEMLVRLIGPLDTVTVIELLDSPGSFSEAEREVMQRGLFHHHPNALGRSPLGRGQVVLNYRGYYPEGSLVSAGESAKAVHFVANAWPIVSVRVCHSRDWFNELALEVGGPPNTDIAGTLGVISGRATL
jgi:hypothetical protein